MKREPHQQMALVSPCYAQNILLHFFECKTPGKYSETKVHFSFVRFDCGSCSLGSFVFCSKTALLGVGIKNYLFTFTHWNLLCTLHISKGVLIDKWWSRKERLVPAVPGCKQLVCKWAMPAALTKQPVPFQGAAINAVFPFLSLSWLRVKQW